MKIALRILAVVLLLGAVGFWKAQGSHHWTVNTVEHYTTDPLTGLNSLTYEKGFVPGMDFLCVIVLISTALISSSFLLRKKRTRTRRKARTAGPPA